LSIARNLAEALGQIRDFHSSHTTETLSSVQQADYLDLTTVLAMYQQEPQSIRRSMKEVKATGLDTSIWEYYMKWIARLQ
jgi:hypothetical protein